MELEGRDDRLDDTYYKPNPIQKPSTSRDNPIQTCYEVARDRGYNYFGVNNGGWCLGSFDAEFTFKKHGKVTSCKDGVGAQWASDVYFILKDNSKSLLRMSNNVDVIMQNRIKLNPSRFIFDERFSK